jgi:hypothetical protein
MHRRISNAIPMKKVVRNFQERNQKRGRRDESRKERKGGNNPCGT